LKKNILNACTEKIAGFPLWVKQRIYLNLRKDLQNSGSLNFIENSNLNFSSYVPILTYKGTTELESRSGGYDTNIYNFLGYCKENYTLIEISLNTFLTIEEICKLFEFCIEQDLVRRPVANGISTITSYMSGKLRLGEYFKRLGTITVEDLESAITEYKHKIQMGETPKFGEILRKLNLISENDLKSILQLKEESKQRFILDISNLPKVETVSQTERDKFEQEIKLLTDENTNLKIKLRQILNLVKRNEQ
jgi:hypothetical protein